MLLDAHDLPDGDRILRDVCIVGGGAAGLTIAHELGQAGIRAVVVEAGDVLMRRAAQRLYEGAIAGESYYPLDACRFRMLGGSTSYWGGWCRPLDAIDFEPIPWVAESGWPFGRCELDPFYRRAQAICGLGPFDYDAASWKRAPTTSLVRGGAARFEDAVFQVRPMRFGPVYGTAARASRDVDVLLNATAVGLVTHSSGQRVIAVRAATRRRRSVVVQADVFMLAAGCIENARILLVARRAGQLPADGGEAVGRFFSDHLHVPLGVLRPRGEVDFYQRQRCHGVTVRGAMSLTDAARRADGALGVGITLHSADDPHDVLSIGQTSRGYAALRGLIEPLRRGRLPDSPLVHGAIALRAAPEVCRLVYRRYVRRAARAFIIGCRAEQAPNAESRVTLDGESDSLGLPKARLEWRLSDRDLSNVARAQAHLADELRDHDVEMFPRDGDNGWRRAIAGGAHHIGTTRMHRDPSRGAVDEHCRVHGTSNLYVAGSSVFPTGGWAPPTLTVVALALRLADTVAGRATAREAWTCSK